MRRLLSSSAAAWLAFAATGAVLIAFGVRAYDRLQFATDGFHYFAFLRNVAEGRGWWEGPSFEYLLGNHSYLAMLLLVPFVAVFTSPLVLLCASVACHLAGAALLFVLARRRFADRPDLPWLFAIAFLLYPTSFGMIYADVYLFQPDLMVIPLVLGMVLAIQTRRPVVFAVLTALLVFTKEELVVVGPAVLLWTALLDRCCGEGAFFGDRRRVFAVAAVYVVAAAVSVSVLVSFRSMNQINFAARGAHLEFLGRGALWSMAAGSIVRLLAPLAPALILASTGSAVRALVIGATVGVFVVGRVVGSMIVYDSAPFVHWTYAAMAPIVFATLVAALPRSRIRVPAALVFCIAASAYLDRHDRTLRMLRGIDLVNLPGRVEELDTLRRALPPPSSPAEAIVTSPFDEAPFIDRALIDADVLAVHPSLADAATWMVVRHEVATTIPAARQFIRVAQTAHYVLLKNPRIP